MYMMTTRTWTCNVRPNIITIVRRATSLVDFQDDIRKWCRSPLDNSTCRLCSTQREDKHITYSTSKTLSQTKKEQNWCYDPTIKHESLRQCAVPRYAYCDYSVTDDSSDSEVETGTMTVEEVQTQKDKILAKANKEKPFIHPRVNYELLKKFVYVDSPDSFVSPPSDSETDTPEKVKARRKEYFDASHRGEIFYPNPYPYPIKVDAHGYLYDSSASETENETGKEAQARKDKFLAGTKDEQLFCYNPSIEYEPLKRFIVPRFAFFDSSSTDWSSSSDSDCETEIVAEKGAQSQDNRIRARSKEEQLFGDDFMKSPSTDLQSTVKDLAKSPSTNYQSETAFSVFPVLVNHRAKTPTEGGDKVLNQAKRDGFIFCGRKSG